MKWPWKKNVIVLGAELAAAQKAEERRIALGTSGPSPLFGLSYDFEKGEGDLVTVAPLPVDLELRAIAEDFHSKDLYRRREIRESLTLDDLYTLIHFVKRAAVLAMNHDPINWCTAGLTTMCMIDDARVDWRDAAWAVQLLGYTISSVEGLNEKLVNDTAALPATVGFLKNLLPSDLASHGYAKIRTAQGVGLIPYGSKKYEPTVDLTDIALQISKNLTQGRYVGHVEIATDIPEVWFRAKKGRDVSAKLSQCLGVACVRATLRGDVDQVFDQMFIQWIAEMPSEEDCKYLVEGVDSGNIFSGRYTFGLYEKKVFALLVAGSVRQNGESYETPDTLAEFGNYTREVLCQKL